MTNSPDGLEVILFIEKLDVDMNGPFLHPAPDSKGTAGVIWASAHLVLFLRSEALK